MWYFDSVRQRVEEHVDEIQMQEVDHKSYDGKDGKHTPG